MIDRKSNNRSGCDYSEHVFFLKELAYRRICIHDIEYLEAQQNYCLVHLLLDKGKIMVSVPMCEVLEYLDPQLFVRIHRSFTVNIEHVTKYASNMVEMDNGKSINIGREYRCNINNSFVLIGSRKRVKEGKTRTDTK